MEFDDKLIKNRPQLMIYCYLVFFVADIKQINKKAKFNFTKAKLMKQNAAFT